MDIDIESFKARLLERRSELLKEREQTEGERDSVELDQARVGRLSRMDAMQSQAMTEAAERRREMELRRIAAALHRMEEDSYGYCEHCGEPIAIKRLEIDPAAELCIRCASQAEQQGGAATR
jgi:DnaK suppressor protein